MKPIARESPSEFLHRNAKEYREHADELWFDCFGCGEGFTSGKCSMSVDTGAWNCKGANCPGIGPDLVRSGSTWTIKLHLGEVKPGEKFTVDKHGLLAVGKKRAETYGTPTPFQHVEPSPKLIREISDYLEGRALTVESMKAAGVYLTLYPFRLNKTDMVQDIPALAFPTKRAGKVVAVEYRLRDGDPHAGPWKTLRMGKAGALKQTPHLWGWEELPILPGGDARRCGVTEGRFDGIALRIMGYPHRIVSLPGGAENMDWMAFDFDLIESIRRFDLFVDGDTEGVVRALARMLKIEKCYRPVLAYKDANDCLKNGWSKIDLDASLIAAKPFDVPGLKHASEYESLVRRRWDEARGDGMRGDPTGIDFYDAVIRGNRESEVTFVAGMQGSGKSILTLDAARRQSVAGLPVLYIPVEMGVLDSLQWLAQQELGREAQDAEEEIEGLRRCAGSLWLHDCNGSDKGLDPNKLKEPIEVFARKYGGRHVFLDNLTCLGIRLDDYQAQTDFVRWAKWDIAKPFNVHFTIVVHVRKPDQSGKSSYSYRPTFWDILGSHSLGAFANNIVMVHRNRERDDNLRRKEDQPDGWAVFEKARGSGLIPEVKLRFNPSSRTFSKWPERKKSDEDTSQFNMEGAFR